MLDDDRSFVSACHPIEAQVAEQVGFRPDRDSDGADAGEAQHPLGDMLEKAQHQMSEQPDPDLPFNFLMVRSSLNHHETGQAVADVDAHVRLCRGFFAPVPRPVDAVKHAFQRRGVNGEDVALETADVTFVVSDQHEVRGSRPEMFEYLPIEALGNCRIARAVGVGEGVAPGWARA